MGCVGRQLCARSAGSEAIKIAAPANRGECSQTSRERHQPAGRGPDDEDSMTVGDPIRDQLGDDVLDELRVMFAQLARRRIPIAAERIGIDHHRARRADDVFESEIVPDPRAVALAAMEHDDDRAAGFLQPLMLDDKRRAHHAAFLDRNPSGEGRGGIGPAEARKRRRQTSEEEKQSGFERDHGALIRSTARPRSPGEGAASMTIRDGAGLSFAIGLPPRQF